METSYQLFCSLQISPEFKNLDTLENVFQSRANFQCGVGLWGYPAGHHVGCGLNIKMDGPVYEKLKKFNERSSRLLLFE